jgi:hypothetical protein
MKKILSLLFIFLFWHFAFSQNVSLTLSTTKPDDLGHVLANAESFYASDYKIGYSYTFTVNKYSCSTLNEIYRQKIKVPEVNGKECEVKELVLADGALVLFTTQYDKSEGINRLYANKFNEDGTLDNESRLITTIKAPNKKLHGFFQVKLAENKKDILVLAEKASTETENIGYNWIILDKSLNVTQESSMELPYYGIDDPSVAKMEYRNGKVYFIAWRLKHILDKKERDKTVSEKKLYCYDLKKAKLTEVLLKTAQNSMFDLRLNFNGEDQLILAGLYSTDTKDALFFERATDRIASGAFCEVYSDNLEKLVYRDTLPNEWNGYLYYLNDVFVQKNGMIVLITERKEIVPDGGGSKAPCHRSGNTTVYAFDPSTKEKWEKTIRKEQEDSSTNDLFSTLTLCSGNNLAFIINDNRKNTLGQPPAFKNFGLIDKNVQTKVLIADGKGTMEEDHSITAFSGDVLVYCMLAARISASEMLVPVKTDNGRCLAKLTMK